MSKFNPDSASGYISEDPRFSITPTLKLEDEESTGAIQVVQVATAPSNPASHRWEIGWHTVMGMLILIVLVAFLGYLVVQGY